MTDKNNNEQDNLEEEMLEEQAELTDQDRQTEEENNGDVMQEAEDALKDIKEATQKENPDEKPECGHDPDTLAALTRERADFLNFKQRAAREQQTARDLGKQEAIRAFLQAMDAISRAKEAGDLEADTPFGKIATEFENALEKLGIEQYGTAGDNFDPKLHEALMNREATDEDNLEDGTTKIDKIAEPGYKLGDNIFRIAKVMTVSK